MTEEYDMGVVIWILVPTNPVREQPGDSLNQAIVENRATYG